MDVIEYTPTREQYAYTFGGAAPAMRIKPGTALRLWSDDAFGGVLRSVTDRSSEKVDLSAVNPQTGPFYVEGAEPETRWRSGYGRCTQWPVVQRVRCRGRRRRRSSSRDLGDRLR